MVAPVYLRKSALSSTPDSAAFDKPASGDDPDAGVGPSTPQADLFGAVEASETIEAKLRPAARTKARGGVLPALVAPELHALAQRLPATVQLGTSTWSFPGWRDIVYGDDDSSAKPQSFPAMA